MVNGIYRLQTINGSNGWSLTPSSVPSSEDSCADPKLTARYVTFWEADHTAHMVDQRWCVINAVTPAAARQWTIQGDNFCAWTSPQNSTVAVYLFTDPVGLHYKYVLSEDGSIPTPKGLQMVGLRAYMYGDERKDCGTIPLYALAETTVGDWWYTIFERERDALTEKSGWIDQGIFAYVLPLEHRDSRY